MSTRAKRSVTKKATKGTTKQSTSILSQYNCTDVSYGFSVPPKLFNVAKFFKETGLKQDEVWNAFIRPKNVAVGYHVHFKGEVTSRDVDLTVEFWDGAPTRASADNSEPFAESIMAWLGTLIREPSARSQVMARFEKPTAEWRSRFNLPFKVTMVGGEELVIDGVGLMFPKNRFRATNAFLGKGDDMLYASLQLSRLIEFADFRVEEDISVFNEAVQMIVERTDETKR